MSFFSSATDYVWCIFNQQSASTGNDLLTFTGNNLLTFGEVGFKDLCFLNSFLGKDVCF
jgi:hypothetical protein